MPLNFPVSLLKGELHPRLMNAIVDRGLRDMLRDMFCLSTFSRYKVKGFSSKT